MLKKSHSIEGSLILVAEDHKPLLRNMAFLLTVAGFQVQTAADGAEALRWLKRRTPDLILSDIEMPTVNGYELLRQTRADRRSKSAAFVLMSDQYGYDDMMQALDLGANDFLPKPFDADDLLTVVRDVLVETAAFRRAG